MLKISKKIEYGLISMLYMEQKQAGDLTTSRELAEKFQIPQEMGCKVLQTLAKKGLIESCQGVKGGYRLHKPLEKIKLAEVVDALEGPICIVNCGISGIEPQEYCAQAASCNLKDGIKALQVQFLEFFNNVSLNELQRHSENDEQGNSPV